MGRTVMLRELCCSRAGDKSDTLNLSLIPYDPAHYELLGELVTAEKVKEYFGPMVQGDVVRYDLPNISAYNFVLTAALGGGSTKSLRNDLHGKAMSGPFLDMTIELPDGAA